MRNLLVRGVAIAVIATECGLSCAALGGDEFNESFEDGFLPCILRDVDRRFTLQVQDGRAVATKTADSGVGSAVMQTEFSFAGDFDYRVGATREKLGFRGAQGLLVLFDDGNFLTIYYRGNDEMAAFNSFNGHQWLWLRGNDSGVFRLRRAGTSVTMEFDPGSGFELLGNETIAATERPARAYLYLTAYLTENSAFRGSFDDWALSASTFVERGCECSADFNRDGSVDVFDLMAFQSAFDRQEMRADFAAPWGVLDLFDFLAFQETFGEGC